MADKKINLTLNVWRQNQGEEGRFEQYEAKEIDTNASFLEMLDVVNENLNRIGEEPVLLSMIVEKAYVDLAVH